MENERKITIVIAGGGVSQVVGIPVDVELRVVDTDHRVPQVQVYEYDNEKKRTAKQTADGRIY